ncbi:MAG: c-type cytochrome domain-containing protein, partial [Chthoniobacteraceae bacterium]
MLLSLSCVVATAAAPAPGIDFFERRIRPLLSDVCGDCHGAEKQEGDLRLDSRVGWMKGGASGAVIVPGKPDDSLLISAVRYWDKSLQMPPKHALEPAEVNDLIEWVKLGAPDPRNEEPKAEPAKAAVTIDFAKGRKHWAFQPVKMPALPAVRDKAWTRNEVDLFTLNRMEAAGVKPAPNADRRTLLRRVTYDLTGLPPT